MKAMAFMYLQVDAGDCRTRTEWLPTEGSSTSVIACCAVTVSCIVDEYR